MEKAPHKKDELTIANHVLKLASKLLKVTLNLRQEIVLCIFLPCSTVLIVKIPFHAMMQATVETRQFL